MVVVVGVVIALEYHPKERVNDYERMMNKRIAKITSVIAKHNKKLEEIEKNISVMQRAINIIEKRHEEQQLSTIKECSNKDVITARAVTAIETFSITTKQLKFSPVIHSYLALRLLKQPSTRFHLVKISVKDSLIPELEGTPAAISKEEDQLMAHFEPSPAKNTVPSNLPVTFNSFNLWKI